MARARQTAIPREMQAAALDHFGPPSVLKPHTLPVPEPGPHEVLIDVHGAGVGTWDADIRKGEWLPQGKPKFPLLPGLDGAGVVAARGSRAHRFAVGDQVYGYSMGGFYAQYKAVNEESTAHVPRRLELLHASAVPVPGLTALQGIEDHLHLKSGETLLIFGATGSVGSFAIQFAHAKEAHVIATASGADAQKFAHSLGADFTIDARKEDALSELRTMAPDGLDAALVLAGSANLESLLDLVRPGGRIAYPNGVDPKPQHRPNVRIVAYDGTPGPKEYANLERALEEARIEVRVAEVYPLAQAAEAHDRLRKGRVLGRIVLRV
jgi:NADPH:quinone reductase-like Zn-dependent oxidoreductase